MEEKLLLAAAALPTPRTGFGELETKAEAKRRRHAVPGRAVRIAAAVVLLLCMTTTVYAYGKTKYGLWSGMSSSAYADVQILNWKYDYCFPEKLWELPFSGMSTYYGAPQGASHLEALLSPSYTLHNADYGDYFGVPQEDGTTLYPGNRISISFGTTQTDTWRYHFSVAEDGSCDYEGVQPGSQRTVEYEGYTLHLYTVSYPSVRWEDPDKKLVIDITCYGAEAEDAVLEIARELIDLNRE